MDFVIAPEHPALPGHFPGRPLVPGVVVLDHVVAALERRLGPLAPLQLGQVKFLQPLLPGERARIVLEPGAEGRWRFRVQRDEALVASGELRAGVDAGA